MNKMLKEIKGQPEALQQALGQKAELNRLHALLKKKHNILLMGIGSSFYACQVAKVFLEKRLPGRIDLISSGEALFYLKEMQNYDVVIIASQSGESIETLDAARKLKERGMAIWAITNKEGSSLYTLAEERLLMHAGQEVSSATKTYTNLIALLYALGLEPNASEWAGLDNCSGQMQNMITAYEITLMEIAREMHKKKIRDIYVLGMGPHVATAQEAALLFKEKTWICTEGMSAAEFRHGSVEVIEEGVAVFILGANARVDEFLQKMVLDLTAFGAKVFTVGGETLQATEATSTIPCPGVQEEFLPLVQVVPFQLLSCFLAMEKDLDVDNFRHINKVINKY